MVFRLNEQVKRNIDRFPDDFMFQLTKDETVSLRSQFATLKRVVQSISDLSDLFGKSDQT